MASPPLIEQPGVLVFTAAPGELYLAPRTWRALGALGLAGAAEGEAVPAARLGPQLAASATPAEHGPRWLLRAGAWPATGKPPRLPPPSTTGRPLCAFGAVRPPAGAPPPPSGEPLPWEQVLRDSGGHLDDFIRQASRLPPLASVYLEAPLARRLGERLAASPLPEALLETLRETGARVIRWPDFDVCADPRLRVAEVITSLQRGGAERMVLDLVASFPAAATALNPGGVCARVITTGRPNRAAFAAPPGTIDVAAAPGGRAGRMQAAADAAARMQADLVHVHLLHAADLAPFLQSGIPLLLTVHNMPPGWQLDLETLPPQGVGLLAACSRRVELELLRAGAATPVRTVWNGIDLGAYRRTPPLEAAARALRAAWGVGPTDAVLLSLANPRPQKRLHRLPRILSLVQARLGPAPQGRKAWLALAGEAGAAHPEAREAEARLLGEIERSGLQPRVLRLGAVEAVPALVAACDVLVAVSAWEGLSLALLEALAGGLPVVATDVGGTAEVARDNPAVTLLPADFSDEQAAGAITRSLSSSPAYAHSSNPQSSPALLSFQRDIMAQRYARLLPRVIAAAPRARRGEGVWLVTNNFSTGGAQSSARRLLGALAARGWPVRAAVIQEQPAWPTPGRQALEAAGIPVFALPPLGSCDAADAVASLLEAIDGDPPRAVVMWNLVTQYKVLLADLLLDIPLFDVSPGEMYFTSLDAHFAAPRRGMPYRTPRDYGARLAGVIVKYQAEHALAGGVLGAPVTVIPNGVPVPAAPPPRRGAPGGRWVIGTAARLSPQKKLEQLLEALRLAHDRLPPYLLRIAGGVDGADEAYARRLRELAAGLCVEWAGELRDTADFLQGLDLFVMISEPGGCPNASLEAMAAARPVLATDFGGVAEQVADGLNGRLTPRGDVPALSRALLEAAADPERLTRWGQAGWARARDLFSIERMAADYERTLLRRDE